MPNPYEGLPPRAFWRSAVAQCDARQISELWTSKFSITPNDLIITAGSCFAQHIGDALVRAGYAWYDAEPAPPFLPKDLARQFNYGTFSFRTGNIYTAALMHQWVRWALGSMEPPSEVWIDDGRFYDPFRAAIEPRGFSSENELFATRQYTLEAIRDALSSASLFVFTLGLTEAWRNTSSGAVYPLCPGTVAGEFNSTLHEFHNFRYAEIRRELEAMVELIRAVNPTIRLILTVSPVPLAATASLQHVLVANTESKSALRGVAGDLAAEHANIDYFPSYEIISSFPSKAAFYQSNLRTITPEGVALVMQSFFAGLHSPITYVGNPLATELPAAEADTVCEELVLETFSKSQQ